RVAFEFAEWLREFCPFCHVFWIHAGTPEGVRDGLMDIAKVLRMPKENKMLDRVRIWLETPSNRPWFICIDGVDDSKTLLSVTSKPTARIRISPHGQSSPVLDLPRWLANCPQGLVLVTSRDRQTAAKLVGGRDLFEISGLT
ncbi:hypothetical protein BGZ60DRAFT_337543, partial [Tricladium varicosporioides]